MTIALNVATRALLLSRRVGAKIFKRDRIASTKVAGVVLKLYGSNMHEGYASLA
jgi:deoxycytidylate deaminase